MILSPPRYENFRSVIDWVQKSLLKYAKEVDTGHWQGVPTDPSTVTLELTNVAFIVPTPAPYDEGMTLNDTLEELRHLIQPNLPWADDHFAERVSRVPSNPGEAYKSWPWWHPVKEKVTGFTTEGIVESEVEVDDFKFTHTYQERYWPKRAGDLERIPGQEIHGIRYELGDLDDLVNLLLRQPYTRQAYLPIFFPEDTGAVHGGRIPCTLGYQFLLRDGRLSMWYLIRSCDFVRHFRDDLYLSARLLLWILEELNTQASEDDMVLGEMSQCGWPANVVPGDFTFVCPSLHIHKGDLHRVQST